MLEVNAAQTFLIGELFCAPSAQLECLIGSDVEERRRKQRHQLPVKALDEVVGLGIGWGEHVSVRRLAKFIVEVPLQNMVQVAKRLLLGQDGDVVPLRVLNNVFDLSGI